MTTAASRQAKRDAKASSLVMQRAHLEPCPGAGGGNVAGDIQAFLSGVKSASKQRSASLIGWPRANADMDETNTGTSPCQQSRQRDTYRMLQQASGSGRMVATTGEARGGMHIGSGVAGPIPDRAWLTYLLVAGGGKCGAASSV